MVFINYLLPLTLPKWRKIFHNILLSRNFILTNCAWDMSVLKFKNRYYTLKRKYLFIINCYNNATSLPNECIQIMNLSWTVAKSSYVICFIQWNVLYTYYYSYVCTLSSKNTTFCACISTRHLSEMC